MPHDVRPTYETNRLVVIVTDMARLRKISPYVAAILVVSLLDWRLLRSFLPSGAKFTPYLFHSVEKGVFQSPGGHHKVTVVYNDGGAMHSGNHWTWIVADDLLTGKRVVASGYSFFPEISREPFPLSWIDDHTFEVLFVESRRSTVHILVRTTMPH